MSWLIKLVLLALLVYLAGNLLGQVTISIPVYVTQAIAGLGVLLGDAEWFLPLHRVFLALSFVLTVYTFRGVLALFGRVAKMIGES